MNLQTDDKHSEPLENLNTTYVKAIPRRHWDRLILTIFSIAVFISLVYIFTTSENLRWDQVWHYLFLSPILMGLWVTIRLTVLTVIIGSLIGVLVAMMALSDSPVARVLSSIYIWIFRGTPLLVQIIIFFNLALFIPTIGIGKYSVSTNSIMTSFVTALISLGLYQGAYMSEIIRGGILSVPVGQREAALSQGLSKGQTMQRIIFPQAMRVIIPATGNQAISTLKSTALVSVIAANDLLTQAQIIYYRNYLIIELLFVASIWYLVLTTIGSIGQAFLEDKYSAGAERTERATIFKQMYTQIKAITSTNVRGD